MEVRYNFQRLKGRIKEYYGNQTKFAKELGITKQALSRKLTSKTRFSFEELEFMIDTLHIKPSEIQDIFFTRES